jgi:thiamine biosynthesis lipoprotein
MMSQADSRVSFAAFGSTAVVAVADPSRLDSARDAVERTVAAFDLACSRFRDDSEISKLNRAGGSPVRAGPVLLDAIHAALGAAEMTDGDVDPTIGQALIALGYDRDFAELGDTEPRSRIEIVPAPGWTTIEVDAAAGTIRVPRGVSVDLGASAKALAADRAAAAAQAEAGCGVLVSFGGDIALAGPAPAEGWHVRVTDDHRGPAQAPGQSIVLRAGGLATSSTTTRRWRSGGGQVHHLLDPRSGRPTSGEWRTVTVAAASCLHANTASTAAIIRGARALDWLASLQLPSRLVSEQGRVVHVADWPDDGEELAA